MNGLAAYDDDNDSLSDAERTNKRPAIRHSTDPRKLVIRRPPTSKPNRRVAHLSGDVLGDEPIPKKDRQQHDSSSTTIAEMRTPSRPTSSQPEALSALRAILKPPPIPDVEDWGIPPPSTETPNPALQTKLGQFAELKHHATDPKHFNDSLMSNRSFRNPHLYAKLVEFIDVDEKVTNFPRELWDPFDVKPEWFAERIADEQKAWAEKQAAGQAPGKRTRIDFVPARHKDPPAKKSRHGAVSSYAGGGTASSSSYRAGPYTRRS